MWKKWTPALDILVVLAGNLLYAFGVTAFVQPGGLITGGSTGIGLFVQRTTGISMSVFVLLLNTALFILGYFVLGKKFAATTALSTFFYPVALEIWQRLLLAQPFTQDLILCTVFGGLCIGAAIGMTMRVGSSTGGMDVPPLVLNRLFHWPVAPVMYGLDMVILLLQALFSGWEQILYGILLLIVYTMTLNKALLLGQSKVELKVVSSRVDEIRRAILSQVDRGGTLLKSRTGYRLQETELLLSVISARELNKAEKLIHQIDPDAFLIVSRVSEVSGRGFTLKKQYLQDTGEQTHPA